MQSRIAAWYRSTLGHALIGAALLLAALPRLDLWPLAWIAPVWWLLLVRRKELPGRRPYGSIWLAGFIFWLVALHWLCYAHWSAACGLVLLAWYLAFYLPVFVGLARVAVHQLRVPLILAAPVTWTGLELARGHLLGGITMASLGHTQYRWLGLIQLSDLAGAYGVSFVVMLAAACLARMLPCDGKPRAFWPLLSAAAAVGAAVLYGHVRMANEQSGPATRILLVQGCIDTEVKFDPKMRARVFQHYFDLSYDATIKHPNVDLLVWPETMFRNPLILLDRDAQKPAEYEDSESEFQEEAAEGARAGRELIRRMAEALGAPLLLGIDVIHYRADGFQLFNSAIYVDRQGEILDRYDKVHPVVFGEYVPLAEQFPWLMVFTPLGINLTAGTRPSSFTVGQLRVSPNICYETVLPHTIREQVNTLKAQGAEPDVLINLTNDGWFWGSSELDMHLVCGVFRAVECRKPLLVAANTGFSAWIDGNGRLVRCGPRRATDVILAEVRPDGRGSWYLDHGDWLAGVCLAGCLISAAVGAWRRLRNMPEYFRKNLPKSLDQRSAAVQE